MDKRSEETLKRWGAERILTDLVNIPRLGDSESLPRAKAFIDRYGALRPEVSDPSTVLLLALAFQKAWDASRDPEAVGSLMDDVFAPRRHARFYGEKAAITADSFSRGKFTAAPRDMLDALGMELLRSRKRLHRCERAECGRYFVKTHSRDRYCSTVCSEEIQRQRQATWVREHRKPRKGKRS